jgi:hypothetical protein
MHRCKTKQTEVKESRGDQCGCEMLRIQHCLDSWLIDVSQVVSLMHQLCSAPGNIICVGG